MIFIVVLFKFLKHRFYIQKLVFHLTKFHPIGKWTFQSTGELVAGGGWSEFAEDSTDVLGGAVVVGIVYGVALYGKVKATDVFEHDGVTRL